MHASEEDTSHLARRWEPSGHMDLKAECADISNLISAQCSTPSLSVFFDSGRCHACTGRF